MSTLKERFLNVPKPFSSGSSQPAEEVKEPVQSDVKLKKSVDLFSGIALIVGTMIGKFWPKFQKYFDTKSMFFSGSGIFVSPTGLLERTGSIQYSLLVWGLCGVVSMFGALAYAELGTMIPSSGAEYSYYLVAFGPFPAYMFSWVSTIIIKPSQLAIICLSFAEYVVEAFTYECAPSPDLLKMVGMTTVAVVTLVNCLSVKLATMVQNVFCFCKLLAIGIIIGGGVYQMSVGERGNDFLKDSNPEPPSIGRIATAFYSAYLCFRL